MLQGEPITFKNKPNDDGTLSTFTIDDCMIADGGAMGGSPSVSQGSILIHLPIKDQRDVNSSFVDYKGSTYHVISTSVGQMEENTPAAWDRFAVAEKIY